MQALSGRFLRCAVTSLMSSKKPSPAGQTREDRLKAALKANMGRRKAQARARSQAKTAEQVGDQAAEKKE